MQGTFPAPMRPRRCLLGPQETERPLPPGWHMTGPHGVDFSGGRFPVPLEEGGKATNAAAACGHGALTTFLHQATGARGRPSGEAAWVPGRLNKAAPQLTHAQLHIFLLPRASPSRSHAHAQMLASLWCMWPPARWCPPARNRWQLLRGRCARPRARASSGACPRRRSRCAGLLHRCRWLLAGCWPDCASDPCHGGCV